MKNNKQLMKEQEIKLPKGKLCGYCCGDCIHMDLERTNAGYYCDFYHNFAHSPSESGASSCRGFVAK